MHYNETMPVIRPRMLWQFFFYIQDVWKLLPNWRLNFFVVRIFFKSAAIQKMLVLRPCSTSTHEVASSGVCAIQQYRRRCLGGQTNLISKFRNENETNNPIILLSLEKLTIMLERAQRK